MRPKLLSVASFNRLKEFVIQVSRTGVRSILNKFQETHRVQNTPGSGRK